MLPPYIRHSSTSQAAAIEIQPNAGTLQREVLEHLRDVSSYGATDCEIQRALKLSGDTQRPRRWELLRKGLIADSGRRRRTDNGKWAVVWVAP